MPFVDRVITAITELHDVKNPTLLQGVAKRIIWQQQCRVYVNCRVCQFCRAYEVHTSTLFLLPVFDAFGSNFHLGMCVVYIS